MLIIEFTNTYGDVGRVEILRIFHPPILYGPLFSLVVSLKVLLLMLKFIKMSTLQSAKYMVLILGKNILTVLGLNYMGLHTRKPVFGVSNKERFKPVSSATETS